MIMTQNLINKLIDWQAAGNRFILWYQPSTLDEFGMKPFENAGLLNIGMKFNYLIVTLGDDACNSWSFSVTEETLDEDFEQLILKDMMDFVADRYRKLTINARKKEGVA